MNVSKALKAPSLLYRLLSPLSFIFWFIHALTHSLKYKEWFYLPQRLGFSRSSNTDSICIHASSVGEVNLIKPLCESLLAQNLNLTITTFTATGFKRASQLFSSQAHVIIMPMDCWPISWIFAKRLKAKYYLIAETELWPETLYQIAKQQIPLIHINARLSTKSLNAPKAIQSLLKSTLSYFNCHLTRYDYDVKNFISMGVDNTKVKQIGNLKYAQQHDAKRPSNLINHPYILFASTHTTEEDAFASLLLLQNKNPDNEEYPLFVIAPRHPTRSASIVKSLISLGINKKYIAVRSHDDEINDATKIYLADTLGEMDALYQHANIVVMGGSFDQTGGHNILEPSALGACIITGPSDNNIKQEVIDLKTQSALIQVSNINELENEIQQLLVNDTTRKNIGNNAFHFIQNSQQVLQNYLEAINQSL